MLPRGWSRLAIVTIVRFLDPSAGWGQVQSSPSPSPTVRESVVSDFKYLVNNLEADGEDIVTAPLHLGEAGAMLTNPRFYWVLGAAGAAFGGSFALDYTMRM
ncbi:MAG TPA: hypothetical protein DEP35_10230, partial [Deltaproteobacteria bacterium]|nr:hypothetical protein [Deltaproteobacteria bacterium]